MSILDKVATFFRGASGFDASKRSLDSNQQSYLTRMLTNYGFGDDSNTVSIESGIRQDTVYTAIKRIADSVAMTPLPVYERTESARSKARQHPVYRVLNSKANMDLTSYSWKHVTACHLLGWGNSFSEIERNNKGQVIALNIMHPADVKIEGRSQTGELVYSWTNDQNQTFLLPASRVLHIRGLSFDGIIGCSPILHLHQLVGRAKAREEFQSRFYRNGAQLGGVITTPEGLTDEQLERHRQSFEALYKGPKNAGKILLLEGTQKFDAIGISPKDAEFIATAKLDSGRIAAAFGVPLQLINDTETVTRSSAEQLFREFLMLGLNTIFSNIESQINVSLFADVEQQSYYVEFVRESLVQSDFETLIGGLQKEVLTAIMTPNEAREKLNMNPIDGGDILLAPVNMVPIDRLGKTAAFQQPQQDQQQQKSLRCDADIPAITPADITTGSLIKRAKKSGRKAAARQYQQLLHDAFDRIGKRERQDISKAAKKLLPADPTAFKLYLNDYYAKDSPFAAYLKKTIEPVMTSMSDRLQTDVADELDTEFDAQTDADKYVNEYIDTLLFRYTASSRRQLEQVVNEATYDDDIEQLIDDRLNEWEEGTSDENPTRAEKTSEIESNRMSNSLTRLFFIAAGVTKGAALFRLGRKRNLSIG